MYGDDVGKHEISNFNFDLIDMFTNLWELDAVNLPVQLFESTSIFTAVCSMKNKYEIVYDIEILKNCTHGLNFIWLTVACHRN